MKWEINISFIHSFYMLISCRIYNELDKFRKNSQIM